MQLGIITPTLNRVRKTRRFIHCLERQTYKDFRLYLVDSGSTDGTRDLPVYTNLPCQVILATPNEWWAACTNIGIRRALEEKCDLILTINDDSLISDTYLEDFLGVFQRYNVDILGNRIDFADEPGRIWALGSYSVWGSPFLFQLRYNGYWADELEDLINHNEILESMTLCGDGVLIRREVFDKIGLYNDVQTPQVHADAEFILRAEKHGITAYVTTRVVLYNDVYNDSEDSVIDQPKERTKCLKFYSSWKLLRDIRNTFFHSKSDVFWRPVVYIVNAYAPRKYAISTLIRFFTLKLFQLIIANRIRAERLQYYASKRTMQYLKRIYQLFRRRFKNKVFNFNNYESATREFLSEDWRKLRSLNELHKSV